MKHETWDINNSNKGVIDKAAHSLLVEDIWSLDQLALYHPLLALLLTNLAELGAGHQ